MNADDTAAATETVAPKTKAAAKKTPAKTKATAKATSNGKPSLSSPQVRILAALKKAGKNLNRTQLAEKAKVDVASVGNQAGYADPAINSRPVHQYNLLNRGLVKIELHEEDRAVSYKITAAGIKALEAAK